MLRELGTRFHFDLDPDAEVGGLTTEVRGYREQVTSLEAALSELSEAQDGEESRGGGSHDELGRRGAEADRAEAERLVNEALAIARRLGAKCSGCAARRRIF